MRRTWAFDPATAYRLISDVVATAEHSNEVLGVRWERQADPVSPSVGDRFSARNRVGRTQWTSTSVVVCAEPGRRFAFAVGDPDRPTAVWSFDLTAQEGSTTVEYTVVLGSGPSMFDTVRHLDDEQYDAIVEGRLDGFAASMSAMLDALGAAARSPTS